MKRTHRVVFKNGTTETISHKMAMRINNAIPGNTGWISFVDDKNEVFLIINLAEVAYIIDSEYTV